MIFNLVLMMVVFFQSFSHSALAAQTTNDKIYISLTPKNTVQRYIERFPTAKQQVVLTREPVAHALKSFEATKLSSETFYAVELLDSKLPSIKGEKIRVENLAIVAIPTMGSVARNKLLSALHQYPLTRIHALRNTESAYPDYSKNSRKPYIRNLLDSRFQSRHGLQIDPAFLKQKLSEYSGATPVIINNQTVTITERGSAKGRTLARAYLAQEYTKLGFEVSTHSYSKEGINFIAEKKGTNANAGYFILSSHLDSVGNAGADDDGSGTVSVLAIAKALSQMKFKHTLRVVAFDEEELGLVGSKQYAKSLQQSGDMARLVGVIHLEMNAYHTKNTNEFHVIDCNENTSASLSQAVMDAVQSQKIQLKRFEACTSASDHSVFWKYGKPSIVTSENFFGHDGNHCYHKACDKVDILNFDYMAKITLANAYAMVNLLQESN